MFHEANGIVKEEWSHYLTETELKNHKHLYGVILQICTIFEKQ